MIPLMFMPHRISPNPTPSVGGICDFLLGNRMCHRTRDFTHVIEFPKQLIELIKGRES